MSHYFPFNFVVYVFVLQCPYVLAQFSLVAFVSVCEGGFVVPVSGFEVRGCQSYVGLFGVVIGTRDGRFVDNGVS